MKLISVSTHRREELIDITSQVRQTITTAGIQEGICMVYIPHTTAGVTINENADPSVKSDILMALDKMVPNSLPFTHSEGNSTGHVKASIMGSSLNIIISNGNLQLGTWQGIFFCEFDGPRNRKVYIYWE